MASLRTTLGVLAYDLLRYVSATRARGRWIHMRNRAEEIKFDGRGIECTLKYMSELHIANVFPKTGTRLMQEALAQWPVSFADAPRLEGSFPAAQSPGHPEPHRAAGQPGNRATPNPDVTFVIGHRGSSRLPHLQLTLRSIGAQQEVAIECVVVEQAPEPEIRSALPPWVRYVHQPAQEGEPYRRAATFNEGVRRARGRLLVLHDNDLLVPERYAAEIVARAAESWEAMDLKRFVFYLAPRDSERVLSSGRLTLDERSDTVIQNVRGGSIAITREAYDGIGGFDESFVGWGGEDLEFWERAETRRATRFGYLPMIHLWHAAQPEKLQVQDAPAIKRYFELAAVPVEERIERLRRGRG